MYLFKTVPLEKLQKKTSNPTLEPACKQPDPVLALSLSLCGNTIDPTPRTLHTPQTDPVHSLQHATARPSSLTALVSLSLDRSNRAPHGTISHNTNGTRTRNTLNNMLYTPCEGGPSLEPCGGLGVVVHEPQVEARLRVLQDVLPVPGHHTWASHITAVIVRERERWIHR